MSLFKELKRRNVIRVAIAYAVVSWVLIQIGNILFSTLELGPEPGKILLAILLLGFIPAVIFSWAFEITPEGVKKEKNVQRDDSITNITAKKLDMVIIGLMVAAIGLFSWQSMKSPTRAPVNVQSTKPATQETTSTVSESVIAEINTDENSIAVLPFVDMSPDKDQEYFTDGLTENLLHALAQIREIKVAGRTSSFAFKNKNVDLREIGDTLNVQKILEGSVQKSGTRLRITAQLIDVDDGFHIWSKTFDRELVDIFSVQDEITAAVVNALRNSLLSKEELNGLYTGNFDAYNAYLLGHAFLKQRNEAAYEKAIEQFQSALKIDPNMALAWSGLSMAYSEQTGFGTDFATGFEKARSAALKAIDLDPKLPEAHLALADVQKSYDWDWNGAEVSLLRAYSLRPGDVDIVVDLAGLKALKGNFTEALEDIEQALAQDPLNERLKINRASMLIYFGRVGESLPVVKEYLSKYPERGVAHFQLSIIYYNLGQYEKALEVAKNEKFIFLRLQLEAIMNDKLGNKQVAQEKLKELIETFGDDVSWQVAAVYAAWGDADQAFAALDRGYEVRDPGLIYIQGSNWYKPYRNDPRYDLFLKKMGFR